MNLLFRKPSPGPWLDGPPRGTTPRRMLLAGGLMALGAGTALAQDTAPAIDTGDTSWMLISTALVLLMTPGLAFFYGGLVRSKNVLGTMMHSWVAMAISSVVWILIGYTLAFGEDVAGLIGGLEYAFMNGVDGAPADADSTIPHLAFMMFQGMFAIITPALMSGAFAERMKFSAYTLFIFLWLLLVYCPLCHWVWGGGWIGEMGWLREGAAALDFAGGTVVHISSGISALVACLMIGRRRGFPDTPMTPHNVPFVLLGGGLLWFGWFGFNAGSQLAADGVAAGAFVATNTAAAGATLAWMLHDIIRFGKPTAVGAISGAVAGLVGVTPAAGFVTPIGGLAIGVVTGFACAAFVYWRTKKGIDDSLDTFGVHGIGGTVGALLTGVFATSAANAGVSGLIDGNAFQLVPQVIGVLGTYVYAGVVTFVMLKVLDAVIGLRVTDEAESIGLDQTQHGESGYSAV